MILMTIIHSRFPWFLMIHVIPYHSSLSQCMTKSYRYLPIVCLRVVELRHNYHRYHASTDFEKSCEITEIIKNHANRGNHTASEKIALWSRVFISVISRVTFLVPNDSHDSKWFAWFRDFQNQREIFGESIPEIHVTRRKEQRITLW